MSLRSTLKNLVDKVFENWEVKLMSLLIAVGLWFYIKNLNISEYEVYIPVYYANLPSNYVIINSNEIPKYVSLKINSSRKGFFDSSKIKDENIVAIVDLSKKVKDGNYKVTLSKPLPSDNLTYSINPSEIYVNIDVVTNKLVKVIPNDSNYVSIPSEVFAYFPSKMSNKVSNVFVNVQKTAKEFFEVQLPSNELIRYEPSIVYLSNTNF
jgi:YbbR domain-containing protein